MPHHTNTSTPAHAEALPPVHTPVTTAHFSSSDPGEVDDFIARTYDNARAQLTAAADPTAAFEATAATTTAPSATLTATTIHSGLGLRTLTEPIHAHLFFTMHHGRARVSGAGGEVLLGPGDTGVYDLSTPLTTDADRMDLHTLQLSTDHLQHAAEETTGPSTARVRFLGTTPVSAAMGRYWRAVVGLGTGALFSQDSPLAVPVLAEQTVRTIALAALHTFPNTTMTTDPPPGPGQVGPGALRRAVAHMEEHASEPMKLAEVAAAAGTSVRALQQAFTGHYGISPMSYLTRVRLQRAHLDLHHATLDVTPVATINSTPAATVDVGHAEAVVIAEVAARWGFAHVGRFSAAYRRAFGVLPGATLRS